METEFNIFGKKINKNKLYEFIKIVAKVGLLLLIFGSIYLLNHSVLLSPDDYNYTFVQGSHHERRVDSIANCLETAKYFYNNWTGRVIPHVLIGIFRNINPIIYEIVNSLVFILFITTITKVLNKKSTFLGILSVFGYLSFSMMFGEKFAWISGAFNYLWPSTFLVLFIYYFYNYFIGEKELNKLAKIALILFAFVTGFMHENVAFVGGAFLVCLCLFKIKEFIKFDTKKKIIVSLIFVMFCLGALATIFAPGNFTRMDNVGSTFSWTFLQNYKDNKLVLNLVIISMLIVFGIQNFKIIKEEKISAIKKLDFSIIKTELLYFILPALIATIPMAVISYFPPRAFLAYEVMFMIVFAKNITYIAEKLENKYAILAIISIISCLIVFGKFSPSTLGQINYIIPYKEKVTMQYEQAVQKGEKDVLVSKFEYANWIHAEDWINIANFFPEFNHQMPVNALIAEYYGFDRVTAIGDFDYLIDFEVDTEGINQYTVIEKETGNSVQYMEYANSIRYCIPKDKLGSYVLDCRENGLEEKILKYNVKYIGGQLTENEFNLNDLIITK